MQGKGADTNIGEYEQDHESGLQRKESERKKETWQGWGINVRRGRGSREKTCHGMVGLSLRLRHRRHHGRHHRCRPLMHRCELLLHSKGKMVLQQDSGVWNNTMIFDMLLEVTLQGDCVLVDKVTAIFQDCCIPKQAE